MIQLLRHRPVDPGLISAVVEHVRTSGRDVSGLDVIAALGRRGVEAGDVQRAMQVALDQGKLALTLDMTLAVGTSAPGALTPAERQAAVDADLFRAVHPPQPVDPDLRFKGDVLRRRPAAGRVSLQMTPLGRPA